jgi:predicted RNA-binding protein associated with RNAse of E/G family
MVETFYTDRWYNIMEVHDADDDRLKGWYCNITRPPSVTDSPDGSVVVRYQDLALDAYINPVGDVLVLDEDELAELQLPAADHARVWFALGLLRGQAEHRIAPFDRIQG